MPVPLLDLRAQFTAVEPDIRAGLETVITDQRFIMGAEVGQLEQAIADFAGVGNAVACASGTDALLLVLKTLDL
ncbi:MAG: DegT/DnrJ/EryC1/StrS family aminotransferase, partial [Gemmatimonadales bacterium]